MSLIAASVVCAAGGFLLLAVCYLDGLGFDLDQIEQAGIWLMALVYPACWVITFRHARPIKPYTRYLPVYISALMIFLRVLLGRAIFEAGLGRRLEAHNLEEVKAELAQLANEPGNAEAGSIAHERLRMLKRIGNLDSRIDYAFAWSCDEDPGRANYVAICLGGRFRQWTLVYSTGRCMPARYALHRWKKLGADLWFICPTAK